MDTESELHRKTLDQLGWLSARYDAGLISPETFRIAVETIWNCMGGVVHSHEFQELMQAANAEVRELPAATHTRLFSDGSSVVVVMRTSEQVRLFTASGLNVSTKPFDLEDEAASYVSRVADTVTAKGMSEISK